MVPRAHRDRQAGRQGADDPRPGRTRGRAADPGRGGAARARHLPLLLRRCRDGQAVRRRGLCDELRRHRDVPDRPAAAGGRRGSPGRGDPGGDRRPVSHPGAQPRQAERPGPGGTHAARGRAAEGDACRGALRRDSRDRRARLRAVAGVGAALLGPSDIRQLAGRLGITPSRRLGQNFVVDAGTVSRITALAGLEPGDVVLEVGPGLGSLTLPLLAAAGRVVAVEVDPVLAAELPRTIAARAPALAGRLEVVTADAARVTSLPGEPPTVLVANLPYNVAVPVVLHLLATLPSLRRCLVMVQAEVADRMCAPPGSRTYGVPSAKLAWYGTARRAGSVPRNVFWPVPRVDSGLVAFTRHEPPAGQPSAGQPSAG